jgi:hypothetical protein
MPEHLRHLQRHGPKLYHPRPQALPPMRHHPGARSLKPTLHSHASPSGARAFAVACLKLHLHVRSLGKKTVSRGLKPISCRLPMPGLKPRPISKATASMPDPGRKQRLTRQHAGSALDRILLPLLEQNLLKALLLAGDRYNLIQAAQLDQPLRMGDAALLRLLDQRGHDAT